VRKEGERNDARKNKENEWESSKGESRDGDKDEKGLKKREEKMNDFSFCV
jgi:hypothetical protein